MVSIRPVISKSSSPCSNPDYQALKFQSFESFSLVCFLLGSKWQQVSKDSSRYSGQS